MELLFRSHRTTQSVSMCINSTMTKAKLTEDGGLISTRPCNLQNKDALVMVLDSRPTIIKKKELFQYTNTIVRKQMVGDSISVLVKSPEKKDGQRTESLSTLILDKYNELFCTLYFFKPIINCSKESKFY